MNAYIRAAGTTRGHQIYVEAVHRLSDLGAVVTHAAHGTSQEGFDAEWRGIHVLTVEGDLISRFEVFDEADLDAAIARFDQLSRPAPRLENAASQVNERIWLHLRPATGTPSPTYLAEDISTDDRRRVVNAGIRHGRDAEIKDFRSAADLGFTHATVRRHCDPRRTPRPHACSRYSRATTIPRRSTTMLLQGSRDRRRRPDRGGVTFDLDDFDAAIAELDARYLAGEAAAHAHTWSVVAAAYAGFNRRELLATTPDWVNIDHRRGAAFAPGDMIAYLHAAWDDSPDTKIYIEAVHRLSEIGAVVTHLARGISQEGFDAEWRDVHVLAVEGDMVSRSELFDEADLDAAIARFDQLSRPAPRLENAASQVAERVMAHFTARDWDAITAMLADDFSSDDRRRVVNAGLRHGRDAAIEEAHANADLGANEVTSTVIATRGDRLVLRRARYSDGGTSARGVLRRCPQHRRDRRRRADRGDRHLRPRRLRRRHRGTRRPLPRRRSGRPRAHVVGHHAGLRRAQPARTSPDDTRLGEHRPPPRDIVSRLVEFPSYSPPHGTSRLT